MLSASAIVFLHDEKTRAWHSFTEEDKKTNGVNHPSGSAEATAGHETDADLPLALLQMIEHEHRSNFELWHIEDEARAPGVTDEELAHLKRRVDRTNQQRNDQAEHVDRLLIEWLHDRGLPNREAELNSESPGLIIDRLSILALKIYHTRQEAERADAPPGHAARNRVRLAILEEQRADLAHCLDRLWQQTLAGARRFKLYLQLKMYNDPALNPAVYGKFTPQQAS